MSKTKRVKITAKLLRELNACKRAAAAFNRLFPNGAYLTRKHMDRLAKSRSEYLDAWSVASFSRRVFLKDRCINPFWDLVRTKRQAIRDARGGDFAPSDAEMYQANVEAFFDLYEKASNRRAKPQPQEKE